EIPTVASRKSCESTAPSIRKRKVSSAGTRQLRRSAAPRQRRTTGADASRACLKRLTRRTLEGAQMLLDGRLEARATVSERREAVERPCAHERLREGDVLEENRLDAPLLRRRPAKQRQRSHDLQPNLPLVALGERPNEYLLVRLDPCQMVVRQLLEQ